MADSITSQHVVGLMLDLEGPADLIQQLPERQQQVASTAGNYRYCSVESELTLGLADGNSSRRMWLTRPADIILWEEWKSVTVSQD